MKRLLLVGLALGLAACAERPLAPVIAAGPSFAAARFECGNKPLPPDPKTVPREKQASAAASYEQRLDTFGQSCQNKLGSVGHELTAAGQVVPALPAPTPVTASKPKKGKKR